MREIIRPPRTVVLLLAVLFLLAPRSVASAPSLDPNRTLRWEWLSPAPQGNYLVDIAYANGLLVAVGAGGSILTSHDGTQWTQRYHDNVETLYSVAFGNGYWVAVGDQYILTSPDGLNWKRAPLEEPKGEFSSVAYGNGRFLAIGGDYLYQSEDGQTWTRRMVEEHNNPFSVAFLNGEFWIMGPLDKASSRHLPSIIAGSDGVTWRPVTLRTQKEAHLEPTPVSMAYGNGVYVVVGDRAISSSANGADWTPRHFSFYYSWSDVTYADGRFVAVGTGYKGTVRAVALSDNGVDWQIHHVADLPRDAGSIGSVIYANGRIYATGGSDVLTSTDGLTWTGMTSYTILGQTVGLQYGSGLFVLATTAEGKGHIYSSPDGAQWSLRHVVEGTLYQLHFASGRFYAETGTAQFISEDGMGWRLHETFYVDGIYTRGNFRQMAYGNGAYVAVSGGGRVYSSADGLTWTLRVAEKTAGSTAAGLPTLFDRVWGLAFVNGQFVLTGDQGYGSTQTATSTDGIEWRLKRIGGPLPADVSKWPQEIRPVFTKTAAGDGLHVALPTPDVAGVLTSFYTSTDGVQWKQHRHGSGFTYIEHLAYGNGRFIGATGAGEVLTLAYPCAERSPQAAAAAAVFTIGCTSYLSDGVAQEMDAAPAIVGGRTLVPLRYLAYALGVQPRDIRWDGATETVTLIKESRAVRLTRGSQTMYVDGRAVPLDVAPETAPPGRLMLPARPVAEAFGQKVNWDSAAQSVLIGPGTRAPAGDTTPPQWAPDSKLKVANSQYRTYVTIEWPRAADPSGVLQYRIRVNGFVVAYLTARDTSYQFPLIPT